MEILHRPPEVTVTLDRDSYAPGGTVTATITIASAGEAHENGVKAGLVRMDQYEVPVQMISPDAAGGGVSPITSGIDETWVATDTLMERVMLPARGKREFTCTWRLPADAATVHEGALETHWLVRVEIDRPGAPDVHAAVEVRLAV